MFAFALATLGFLHAGTRMGYAVHSELTVPAGVAPGTPLPAALTALDSAAFPTMSRARKACRRGSAIINGREGRCISTVKPGDVLSFQERVAPGFTPRGRAPFAVDVVYEDDYLAVVQKPAGVVTHPPPGGAAGSMSMRTAVQHALQPPPVGTAGALYRPHLVHRLDKPTSGLMLVAKTKPALLSLCEAFANRTVRKTYHAIACGWVEGDEGVVDAPIDGQPSQTEWRVLSRARSLKLGGGHLSYLECKPRTGRTHQIRRHLSEGLGAPIVGDKLYGGDDPGSGLYLAALGLAFAHPAAAAAEAEAAGWQEAFEIQPPPKFGALLAREDGRFQRLDESQ